MKSLFLIFLIAFSTHSFAQVSQNVIGSVFNGTNGVHTAAPGTGLVIGIYQKGKISFYATGTRSVSGTAPVDSATIFEVGSATKTFTGLLLALNIQQGKIGLNDHIDNYLPRQMLVSGLATKKRTNS